MTRKELTDWFERAVRLDPGGTATTMQISMKYVHAAHQTFEADDQVMESLKEEIHQSVKQGVRLGHERNEAEIAVARLEQQAREASDKILTLTEEHQRTGASTFFSEMLNTRQALDDANTAVARLKDEKAAQVDRICQLINERDAALMGEKKRAQDYDSLLVELRTLRSEKDEADRQRTEANKEARYQVDEKKRLYRELHAARRTAEPFTQVSSKLLHEENQRLRADIDEYAKELGVAREVASKIIRRDAKIARLKNKLVASQRETEILDEKMRDAVSTKNERITFLIRELDEVRKAFTKLFGVADIDCGLRGVWRLLDERNSLRKEDKDGDVARLQISLEESAHRLDESASRNIRLIEDNKELETKLADTKAKLSASYKKLSTTSKECSRYRKDADAANLRAYKIGERASARLAELHQCDDAIGNLFQGVGEILSTLDLHVKDNAVWQRGTVGEDISEAIGRAKILMIEQFKHAGIEEDEMTGQYARPVRMCTDSNMAGEDLEVIRLQHKLRVMETNRNNLLMQLQGAQHELGCVKGKIAHVFGISDVDAALEEMKKISEEVETLRTQRNDAHRIANMGVVERCKTYHYQNCHECPDMHCGDNQSPLKIAHDNWKHVAETYRDLAGDVDEYKAMVGDHSGAVRIKIDRRYVESLKKNRLLNEVIQKQREKAERQENSIRKLHAETEDKGCGIEDLTSQAQRQREEIDNLEMECSNLREQLSNTRVLLDDHKRSLGLRDETIDTLLNNKDNLKGVIRQRNAATEDLIKERDELREEVQRLQDDRYDLGKARGAEVAGKKYQEVKAERDHLQVENGLQAKELGRLTMHNDDVRRERDELSEQLRHTNISMNRQEKHDRDREGVYENLRSQIQKITAERDALRKKLDHQTLRAGELDDDIISMEEELESAKDAGTKIKRLNEVIEKQREYARKDEAAIKELKKELLKSVNDGLALIALTEIYKKEIDSLRSTSDIPGVEKPPTQWAYDQACKALAKYKAENELLRQVMGQAASVMERVKDGQVLPEDDVLSKAIQGIRCWVNATEEMSPREQIDWCVEKFREGLRLTLGASSAKNFEHPVVWYGVKDPKEECWKILSTESQDHDEDGADTHIANIYDPHDVALICALRNMAVLDEMIDEVDSGIDLDQEDGDLEKKWAIDNLERVNTELDECMDALRELVDVVDAAVSPNSNIDSLTTQPARRVLARRGSGKKAVPPFNIKGFTFFVTEEELEACVKVGIGCAASARLSDRLADTTGEKPISLAGAKEAAEAGIDPVKTLYEVSAKDLDLSDETLKRCAEEGIEFASEIKKRFEKMSGRGRISAAQGLKSTTPLYSDLCAKHDELLDRGVVCQTIGPKVSGPARRAVETRKWYEETYLPLIKERDLLREALAPFTRIDIDTPKNSGRYRVILEPLHSRWDIHVEYARHILKTTGKDKKEGEAKPFDPNTPTFVGQFTYGHRLAKLLEEKQDEIDRLKKALLPLNEDERAQLKAKIDRLRVSVREYSDAMVKARNGKMDAQTSRDHKALQLIELKEEFSEALEPFTRMTQEKVGSPLADDIVVFDIVGEVIITVGDVHKAQELYKKHYRDECGDPI